MTFSPTCLCVRSSMRFKAWSPRRLAGGTRLFAAACEYYHLLLLIY